MLFRSDRMLQITGVVEDRQMRAQYLDRMDIERERGITIKAQNVRLPWVPRSGPHEGEEIVLHMIDTQSTTGYTQHVVVRALTGDAPVIDGIVEEIFPIEAVRDLGVFFDSRGDDERMAANMRAMAASTARFLDDGTVDAVPTGRYVVGVPGSGV